MEKIGLIPLKLVRVYQVRHVGTFSPREYNMEKYFVAQMVREGHFEHNGGGYYSVTETTQIQLEAFITTFRKMDRDAGRIWKE